MCERKVIVVFANDFFKEKHEFILNRKFNKKDKVRLIMIGDLNCEGPIIFSIIKMIKDLKLDFINTSYTKIPISLNDLSLAKYDKAISKIAKALDHINYTDSLYIDTSFSSIELEDALYVFALKFKSRSPDTKVIFNNRIIKNVKSKVKTFLNNLNDESFLYLVNNL